MIFDTVQNQYKDAITIKNTMAMEHLPKRKIKEKWTS